MKYIARVHRACIDELADICIWYDHKRLGLGNEFEISFDKLVDLILINPLGYKEVKAGIRRGIMRKFPYSVFYFIDKHTVVVIGVLYHGRGKKEVDKILKRD